MPDGLKRVFITPLDAVETTDKEGVGTLRFEGNKVYKWVLLQNTTATVAGAANDAVAYAAATGHNTHQVVTDATDADSAPVGAGLLQASVAGVAGTAYYVWIQIKGPATANQALGGSAADGSQLMKGTTDLAMTTQTFSGTPVTADGAKMGVATDASARLVALDCPF